MCLYVRISEVAVQDHSLFFNLGHLYTSSKYVNFTRLENIFLTRYFKISVTARHALHTQGCSLKKISEVGSLISGLRREIMKFRGWGIMNFKERTCTQETQHTHWQNIKLFQCLLRLNLNTKNFKENILLLKKFFLILIKIGKSALSVGCQVHMLQIEKLCQIRIQRSRNRRYKHH